MKRSSACRPLSLTTYRCRRPAAGRIDPNAVYVGIDEALQVSLEPNNVVVIENQLEYRLPNTRTITLADPRNLPKTLFAVDNGDVVHQQIIRHQNTAAGRRSAWPSSRRVLASTRASTRGAIPMVVRIRAVG